MGRAGRRPGGSGADGVRKAAAALVLRLDPEGNVCTCLARRTDRKGKVHVILGHKDSHKEFTAVIIWLGWLPARSGA